MVHPSDNDRSLDLDAPDLLFVEERQSWTLVFYSDNGGMDCVADFSLNDPARKPNRDEHLKPADLIWSLVQHQLPAIDFSAVYEFCAAIELGENPVRMIVARGLDPVCGEDGWFELMVKTSGEDREFVEDAAGYVDLKSLNAYSEIEEGQKLGMVHAPGQGRTGLTVDGRVIPAEPGSEYELRAGEGVELRYGGKVAFASKPGRALLDKNVLRVVDQLVIPGDLGMDVGNVDFKGVVEIRGEVSDDYRVRATAGIAIAGLVGSCHLESDGSIEIGSMAGKDRGTIVCRGDLRASFLNQVSATVYGNVYVTNEIRNSTVKATGSIVVEKGAIIGGECTALEGIESKSAGTGSGQKTRLVAGVYFPDNDRFEYLREQLRNVNRQIDAIDKALAPLIKYHKRHLAAGDASRRRLEILQGKLEQLTREKERLGAEVTASTPQQFSNQNAKINIHKELHEGVTLVLGSSTEEMRLPRSGPVSIIENTEDGGFRFLGLSPLAVNAAAIEVDLLSDIFET